MTQEQRKIALYCLKASSDYHPELCEECVNYPGCDHTMQADITETIIKALEQESVLDIIRAEIEQEPYVSKMEVLEIIDKYRAESEE